MPTAFSILPERFEDGRWRALLDGLKRVGFEIEHNPGWRWAGLPADKRPASRRDVLITWTRHKGPIEATCRKFEDQGGRVIVAEEAHLRRLPNGPYPADQYFSLCLNDHQTFWRSDGPARWASWNVKIAPWRTDGDKILVREQRGIGSSDVACAPDWHARTAAELRRYTDRPIEIVEHPKKLKRRGIAVPRPEEQFADAFCVITWNSHMGTMALLHGVPVIACGPKFFVSTAAGRDIAQVDDPSRPETREAAFARFAWAQWAMSEIRSGEAFRRLLG